MWTPEPLTDAAIESRADELIDALAKQVGWEYLLQYGLKFTDLYEKVIRPRFGIKFVENEDLSGMCDGKGALGIFIPEENVAKLDIRLHESFNDKRRVFTIYHEVCGHGVLQGKWLRAQRDLQGRGQFPCETDETIEFANRQTLERQANAMAGYTAAPMRLVRGQILTRLSLARPIRYIGPHTYCLGPGRCKRYDVVSFHDLCRVVAIQIKDWFHGLSTEALAYRVQRSGLVLNVENRSSRSVLLRTA